MTMPATTPVHSRLRTLLLLSGVAASVLAGCLIVSRAAAQSAASAAKTAATQAVAAQAVAAQAAAAQAAATQAAAAQAAATQAAAARAAAQDEEAARKAAVDSAIRYKSILSSNAASSPFGAEVPPTMVSVNFPGGTVSEYVQMLREAAKDPVNIAAAEQLLTTQISGIELKNVSLMTALRALGTIGDGSGMIDVRDLSLVGKTGERVGSPVYEVIWVPRRMSEESAVTTYSLFDRLPALTDDDATRMAETLVSAAQTALQMSGGNVTWDLKFHRPSRLLLMKGSRGQIEVVSGVVERMTATWARDAMQTFSAKSDGESLRKLEMIKAEVAKDAADKRARMEAFMLEYETRAAEAKKAGLPIPEMNQLEKLRYSEIQDVYRASASQLRRLDEQLLSARAGFHENSSSLESRLNGLEARLNELATMLEKRAGYGK